MVELERVHPVLQHPFVLHRFKRQRFRASSQRVRNQRVHAGSDVFEKRLVALLGDHRQTLRDRGPDPAGMIEVVMGVHEISERLVGSQFARLPDHRQRADVVLRRLDKDQVVGEFHEDAVMRLA